MLQRPGWRQARSALTTGLFRPVRRAAMNGLTALRDADRFLDWSLTPLRIATIVVLLMVTLLQPVRSRFGNPIEIYILAFAAYNVVIEVIRQRVPALHSFAWVPLVDLPVATLIYILGAAPGGLLFIPLFLAVVCAAATMSIRASLLYAAVVCMVFVMVDPTFPLWSTDSGEVRRLSARLIIVALTAFGTAILARRVRLEQATAQASRMEVERHAELNRLRSEFVALISHDLRTPLTGARAGIGMLEASAYERLLPDERELIGSTRRNIQRLGRLIDDLLALNQLDAGALQLNHAPIDLRSIVTDILPTIHPLIHDNGQTLEVDLPEPLPLIGDARRLEQVVLNLVANAHQHTPRGTRITIRGYRTSSEVHFVVHDTGPGIPVKEQQAIWERFYQIGVGRGSSGLGLVIVKAVVELHGGRAWVESVPGAGAAFFIALPATQPEKQPDA